MQSIVVERSVAVFFDLEDRGEGFWGRGLEVSVGCGEGVVVDVEVVIGADFEIATGNVVGDIAVNVEVGVNGGKEMGVFVKVDGTLD